MGATLPTTVNLVPLMVIDSPRKGWPRRIKQMRAAFRTQHHHAAMLVQIGIVQKTALRNRDKPYLREIRLDAKDQHGSIRPGAHFVQVVPV